MHIKHSFPDITVEQVFSRAGMHGRFTMHTHDSAELYCFLSGRGVYHVEGSAYPLEPGDILLMRPTEAHYINLDAGEDYDRIILNFDPELFAVLDPEGSLMRPYWDRSAGKRNRYRAAEFCGEEPLVNLRRMVSAGDRLTILAELILVLQKIGIQFRQGEDVLPDTLEYRIIRYINKNLAQPLSIQDLCERFYISRAQLCRRFQKVTGTTVGKYVSAKRLLLARQEIWAGKKLSEICAACGYQDYSTFFRAYRLHFGCAPREDRNRASSDLTEDERTEIR